MLPDCVLPGGSLNCSLKLFQSSTVAHATVIPDRIAASAVRTVAHTVPHAPSHTAGQVHLPSVLASDSIKVMSIF